MTKKIGIDIVTNHRIQEKLHLNGFLERILSNREIEFYRNMSNEQRRLEFICGRFAAKEAIFKVLPSTIHQLCYCDITIDYDEDGVPIVICEKIPNGIIISISHCEEYAVAVAFLEDEKMKT